MDTLEYMQLTKEQRLNEVGTEAPCPFCQRPRVTRSSYIRCNRCGVNWGKEDDITKDPRLTKATGYLNPALNTGARPAKPTTD